jgi:hypothetical protein
MWLTPPWSRPISSAPLQLSLPTRSPCRTCRRRSRRPRWRDPRPGRACRQRRKAERQRGNGRISLLRTRHRPLAPCRPCASTSPCCRDERHAFGRTGDDHGLRRQGFARRNKGSACSGIPVSLRRHAERMGELVAVRLDQVDRAIAAEIAALSDRRSPECRRLLRHRAPP